MPTLDQADEFGMHRGLESEEEEEEGRRLADPVSVVLLLLIPTITAAVLVFDDIGQLPFWRDEAWSMSVADRSIADTLEVLLNGETSMTLYYLLLNGWTELGSSEGFVRSLSAVFAVVAVPMTILFARQAFSWPAAGIAGAVLALSDLLVVYGQEARSYGLVLLLAPLSYLFFVRAVQSGRGREWVLYTLTAAAMVYAHTLGGLLVVAQFASLSLLPAVNVKWGYAARSLVGLAALCSPVLLSTLVDESNPSWVGALSLRQLGSAASHLAGGRLLLLGFGILFALAVLKLVLVLRRSGRSHAVWIRGLVLLWIALPPILLLAISGVKPLFVDRYLIGILPGIAVMAGAVIAGLRPRGVAWAAAGLLMAAMIGDVATREKPPPRTEDLRAAASLVVTKARPGDGVAYSPPWGRVGFDYYLDRISSSGGLVSDLDMKRGGTPLRTGEVLADEAAAQVVARRIRSSGSVWLVTYPDVSWDVSRDPVSEVGPTIFRRHFVRGGSWDFGEVSVTLYERRTGGVALTSRSRDERKRSL